MEIDCNVADASARYASIPGHLSSTVLCASAAPHEIKMANGIAAALAGMPGRRITGLSQRHHRSMLALDLRSAPLEVRQRGDTTHDQVQAKRGQHELLVRERLTRDCQRDTRVARRARQCQH